MRRNEGVGRQTSNAVSVSAEFAKSGTCAPSSSLAALILGTDVISYFPNGQWGEQGTTGIAVVNVEGSSVKQTVIPATAIVNSCASNSETGMTVCTTNGREVYVIKETTITHTLTDAATEESQLEFSGGSCKTCGVAMDAVHNRALLTVAVGGKAEFQFLNLATLSFETPFAAASGEVSEDPLIDPIHELILSAAENSDYELINVSNPGAPSSFENTETQAEYDSSAEDCETGIALASDEFENSVYLADLTQAKFNSPGAGEWTAPLDRQRRSAVGRGGRIRSAARAQAVHGVGRAGEPRRSRAVRGGRHAPAHRV
jgi:hypothetical protein